MDSKVNYWIITNDERAFGPYEDYSEAMAFATTNLGADGLWTITTTS